MQDIIIQAKNIFTIKKFFLIIFLEKIPILKLKVTLKSFNSTSIYQ